MWKAYYQGEAGKPKKIFVSSYTVPLYIYGNNLSVFTMQIAIQTVRDLHGVSYNVIFVGTNTGSILKLFAILKVLFWTLFWHSETSLNFLWGEIAMRCL